MTDAARHYLGGTDGYPLVAGGTCKFGEGKMVELIGKYVIVRDHRAGVIAGTLTSFDAATKSATMCRARKIWYWVGAAAVEGLADRGPREGSKICPEVSTVVCLDVVQVVAIGPEASEIIHAYEEWRPW